MTARPHSPLVALVVTVLLAIGCATPSPVDQYAGARVAPDFEAGWALCAGAGVDRADCEQAISARFGRFDRCDAIEAGAWREECRFAEAEHLARAGDRPGAVRACQASRYVANCEQHVLDGLAMELREAPAADVATALVPLAPLLTGRNSKLDFWRSWHRVRLDAGLPLVLEACPDSVCSGALRAQVHRAVQARLDQAGCGETPPDLGGASPGVRLLVDRSWRERCCRERACLDPLPLN